jgi:hypothetical protein
MVIGSGFRGSSVAQNLRTSQRNGRAATLCGWDAPYQIVEKMIDKLVYRPAGILHNNDNVKKLEEKGIIVKIYDERIKATGV